MLDWKAPHYLWDFAALWMVTKVLSVRRVSVLGNVSMTFTKPSQKAKFRWSITGWITPVLPGPWVSRMCHKQAHDHLPT